MGVPLIVGEPADPHVSAVASALGGDCFVVDAPQLQRSRYAVDAASAELELEGARWAAVPGSRGWARRLSPMGWETGVVVGSLDAAERASSLSLLAALLRHPDVEWLTPFDRMNSAENKLTQAFTASRLGVPTPATIVSNRAEALQRIRRPLVAKPLGPSHYQTEHGEWLTVFTEAFDPDSPLDLAILDGPPFIVQQRLEASSHLRIVTVQDRAWTFRLDARGLPVDWREERSSHRSWTQCSEHDAAADALRMSEALGLGYSSQDWCETPDGAFHLDLNPAGQWLFLPEPGAAQVTKAIADWLGSGA